MDNAFHYTSMRHNIFTLHFIGDDAPLERPFLENFYGGSRLQVRVALLLSVILIGTFGFLDSLLPPSQKHFVWIIRFILLCPAILIGAGLTFHPKAPKFFPWMQIALINFVGAGFMGMIVVCSAPFNYLYYSGLILVLMYGYTFVRLRFIWASLSGWLLVCFYEVIAWGFTGTEHTILLSNTFFLVTANFIGMVGCYTIERNQRKGFYLAYHLNEEQLKVKASNALLERRVTERTTELESANKALERQITERKSLEEQTRQAQKMESVGLLAGGIAHDFNNILTIIIGNAGLLKMEAITAEKLAHHINAITNSANRGAQLVRQLLTFARKTETVYSPVDINAIAGDVAGLLRETFSRNIAVTHRLAGDLPYINADAVQLHQVFMNICINARDAMPTGGTLTLATCAVTGNEVRGFFPNASANRYVSIAITDTGFGMDEMTQQKIFEPFFTTKETGKGTGLGLAVVYGIMKNHHGFIRVKSAVNAGAEFTIFLPVPDDDELPSANAVPLPEKVTRGNGQLILVMDDEESIRAFLSELLESQGYKVLCAENGEKGIRLFRERRNEIALVISDKGMPFMDGEKVFLALSGIQPDVKFILLTGLIDPSDKLLFLKGGMAEVLLKPIDANDLLTAVGSVIHR